MKKIMILCSAVCMLLCGCSGGAESSVAEQAKETATQTAAAVATATEAATEAPTETQTEAVTTTATASGTDMTCLEVAQAIADKVGGEYCRPITEGLHNQTDAAAFSLDDYGYEIYTYPDGASEYDDAEDGAMALYLGDTPINSKSVCCGRYVMVYGALDDPEDVDQSVIDTFKEIASPS